MSSPSVPELLQPPTPNTVKVGVVGVTGAVGREMMLVMLRRGWQPSQLRCFASERSAGGKFEIEGKLYPIEAFSEESAKEMDVLFLAVSGEFALEHARNVASNGKTLVIDNSSALRYDKDIPLVIPEVNGIRDLVPGTMLVANPNCTTAVAMMALAPLHEKYGLKRVIVSSYQATSGAGVAGMNELVDQTKKVLADDSFTGNVGNGVIKTTLEAKTFSYPIAFNLIPQIDKFQDNGYTKEEMKVTWETQKILDIPTLPVSCTAVRIPTLRAHSEALTIETERECDPKEAQEVLKNAVGVKLVDSPSNNKYPMPMTASGADDVEVGRVRQSLVFGKTGLDLFVCGDQLLRGAALNAVLIAEMTLNLQKLNAQGNKKQKIA
jgi:aspartate-semialdehyde dehydrogenase